MGNHVDRVSLHKEREVIRNSLLLKLIGVLFLKSASACISKSGPSSSINLIITIGGL